MHSPRLGALLPAGLLASAALAAPSAGQVIFDLADACGGGDGSLPGTGASFSYPLNTFELFIPDAFNPYVDGTFVPLESGVTQVISDGTTFNFSFDVGGAGTVGPVTQGGPGNGALGIADPSGVFANPDYTGDPVNHSLLAMPSNVGITYDLDAIRVTAPGINRFTARMGNAGTGIVGYCVLFDGQFAEIGGPVANFSFLDVELDVPQDASYLTLVATDFNQGTTSGCQGYWGDPFLRVGGTGFSAFPPNLSVGAGGTQVMSLDAGPAFAGLPYLVLGSFTGTSPGPIFDGYELPIVFDAYTTLTLIAPNAPPLGSTFSFFDAQGKGTATFSLPPGAAPPALIGATAYHAFLVIEVQPTLLSVVYTSNPQPLGFAP